MSSQSSREIKKQINKITQQVILKEKVKEFKLQIIRQLREAREKKLYWIKKEIALEASLATCEHILKLDEIKRVNQTNKYKNKHTHEIPVGNRGDD